MCWYDFYQNIIKYLLNTKLNIQCCFTRFFLQYAGTISLYEYVQFVIEYSNIQLNINKEPLVL